MTRVMNRIREGDAVQWNGWNENEIRDLFQRYSPKVSITLIPVTDEKGVRTLDLYVLYDESAEDFIVVRGDWFVGHSTGIAVSFVTVVPDSAFIDIYEQLEL